MAMGASFAAMERGFRALQAKGVLSSVAPVYASNTAGAVTGTLLTTFVLMPAIGFRKSTFVLAALNVACSVVAFVVRAKTIAMPARKERPRLGLALAVLFTGFLGIAYETAGIRALSSVLENTIYTFAVALATFLLGTALGAAWYHRYASKGAPEVARARLLLWLAIACIVGIWLVAGAHQIYWALRSGIANAPPVLAEVAVALLMFLAPTFFMGALFSNLVQSAAQWMGGIGRMTALNTLGAALAPAVTGVVAFPLLGAKWTLLTIALGYVALVRNWSAVRWSPLILIIAALSILPANLNLINVPADSKITKVLNGVMASVAVVEDAQGERGLRINNRFQQGGTASANAEYRQADMPLLLHANPQTALFLGVGTGITLGAATLHPGLRAHGVELVPEVVQVLPSFESANFGVPKPPAVTVSVADARRYVRVTTNRYDVIVADLFHPAMDGAGLLYTVEHFRAIRERLTAGGVFCQWLPLFQLDEELVASIGRSFLEVFPDAQAWLLRFNIDAPALGLIGWTSATQYGSGWVEKRLSDLNLERHIRQLTLSESTRFFGHVLFDSSTLRAFCERAPLNTDDLPVVIFKAPRVALEGTEPYRTLLALLELPLPDASSVLHPLGSRVARNGGSSDAAGDMERRLALLWKARNRYLHGLVLEDRRDEKAAIDAYVDSAKLSPDFTLGYARCATLASIRAKTNPEFSRELLGRLIEAQPSQQLAADMLKRLFQ
jgi:spermidine synthase